MRTSTGTVLRTGLALLASLAALTACSGGEDPKPGTIKTPKPASTTAATTASPTPTTPEAQIEATMRAYIDAANEMFKTGDVTEVQHFSTSGCACRKITRWVQRMADRGGQFHGAHYEDVAIRVHDVEGATGLAEVTATVPAYKVVSQTGKILDRSTGGKLHTDYPLIRQEGGSWIIGNALDLG